MERHTLLIDCPDRPGLVHAITGVLFRHGFNVLANGEFVDAAAGHFFMRTEFTGVLDREQVGRELADALGGGTNMRFARPTADKSIVILVTREPHCLGDLLIRHEYGELDGSIRAVVGNRAVLAPLAERFGVPFHHVGHEGRDRAAHEAEILEVVERYQPDYLVLAKYMRVLTPAFVDRFVCRIVNIHHSFLPAFAGASPYQQAYDRGVKIVGATAHFVTADLDQGPIIAQGVIPIDHTHGPGEMAQAGRDVEKIVLARGLRLVLQDRVFVSGNRTVIFD
jgi:formyltetrahydrofolate deformylase